MLMQSLDQLLEMLWKDYWSGYNTDARARYASPAHGSFIKAEYFDGANDKAEASPDFPSQGSNESDQQRQQTFQLQSLLSDATPETLENGVEKGVKLLDKLGSSMRERSADTPDAE